MTDDNELVHSSDMSIEEPKKKRGRPRKEPADPATRYRVGGADLTADVSGSSNSVGVAKRYRYWVGVTPDCPTEAIYLAGICFPKLNEIVHVNKRTGRTERAGVAGALVWIDERQMRRMISNLPRTVVRFTGEPSFEEFDPKTGQTIQDLERPRRGHIITIPSRDEVEEAKKKNRLTREYTPRPGNDHPASKFMFAKLLEDGESRGQTYPDTLDITGLEWPHPIEA